MRFIQKSNYRQMRGPIRRDVTCRVSGVFRWAVRLPVRHVLLIIAFVGVLVPISTHASQGRGPMRVASKWIKISPPRVSTDPKAFNGANFGFGALAVDPTSGAVYVGTCYQGVWKSTNKGQTWVKVNTGTNGGLLDSGRVWALAVDPIEPRVLYATAGYGAGGILKSTDGGVDWLNMIASDTQVEKALRSEDIYSIAIDPANHSHVLASLHGSFSGGTYANKSPILESLDGGATWTIRTAGSLSYPQYIFFLGNSSRWLLGTTAKGFWRTTDSGHRWTRVSLQSFTDGGTELYHAKNGYWYLAAFGNLLRSSNDGRTWKPFGPTGHVWPYMAVVGDGRHLYTQPATAGSASSLSHYYVSSETAGTLWKQFNSQSFLDGPVHMTYDAVRHIVYSSNWRAGVWKLQVKVHSSQP